MMKGNARYWAIGHLHEGPLIVFALRANLQIMSNFK